MKSVVYFNIKYSLILTEEQIMIYDILVFFLLLKDDLHQEIYLDNF